MRRSRPAWLFLGLVVLGILWPVVAGAISCGDCCEGPTSDCGKLPTTGFSLCCFHSVSTLPTPPPSGFALVYSFRLAVADETFHLPPFSRDILHVPRILLT